MNNPQSTLNVLISLQNKGYAKTTLYGISKKLKQLAKHTDLTSEKVLEYISSQRNDNTKNLLANAYDHYAKFYEIKWNKPK